MRIALIGKKYIFKDTLPNINTENYWVTEKNEDHETKLLNFRKTNEKWELISTNHSKIVNPIFLSKTQNGLNFLANSGNAFLPSIELEFYKTYPIVLGNSNDIFILCCFPDCEKFTHLDIINTNEITIGNSNNCNIVYKHSLIDDVHAKIFKFNGKWTVENYDSNYGVFVNDFPVYDTTKNIFNGDIIFIMGLQIVLIKNSLYINNPNKKISLDTNCFSISKIKNLELSQNVPFILDDINKLSLDNSFINYYSSSPRTIPKIQTEQIKIDDPPAQQNDAKKPTFLVLGSSIAMGLLMLTSLTSTIQGISRGSSSFLEIFFGFMTTIAMLIAMIVIPILDIRWDDKSKVKYEQKRQRRYTQYLDKKKATINEIKNKQRRILYENYLSDTECARIITENNPRLWERKIQDDDFLSVRIGIGKVPSKIDISYPQEKFAMEDDNLIDVLNVIVHGSKFIDNAPVTVSLLKNKISAIISKDNDFNWKFMKNIIMQLITFHNYNDLKLVFLLDSATSKDWQYVKMLPHVWDNSKNIRFFADKYSDMLEISRFLLEEMKDRIEKDQSSKDDIPFSPYYLIITNDYKKIQNLEFTKGLFNGKNLGFSLLCITDYVYNAPSACKTFIDIENKTSGVLYENGIENTNQTELKLEPLSAIFFEKIARKLSNIPIRLKTKDATSLPSSYTFLDMFNTGKIEQLDIIDRWHRNDSTLSLKTPIGIDSNGIIINLDAHEKFHGPHGLIAGSTGSGKSEFIITYILSLAINYHPDDVTFLLIDYKGGGLAGAFQKNGIKLPHLVGTITNIDKHDLERSLTSIQSELRRRQVVFNEARNMTDEGTIDIYKYQKLYHDGIVKEPISHLFIICDEFAELKQQQPEFMDELMSVSRIGRSLGVHLILATQKPSGIVNDQIRSNSKFGVCLKVQDTLDSTDIIARPDAAYLKNPGQFYLKVGQNEYFVLGQSGWAGAPYFPSDTPKKRVDSSIEFVSDIGMPIKKIDDSKKQLSNNKGEQLTTILKYISNLAEKEHITTKNLWLDNIPEDIYVGALRDKYKLKVVPNLVQAVIGEYDDPSNQKQGLVKLELNKKENIIIYGNAESGKETLLSTFTFDLMTSYSTKDVQIYILDFGTEALKIFKPSPHVGDVIFLGQTEKLDTFFELITSFIKERKNILSNYNGDLDLYVSKGNVMPIITIIINNYEAFSENYEDKYDDLFLTITREGPKCGILFVVTASSTSAMRFRLTQNFNKKIGLQINDESDYYSMFDNVQSKRPTHIFGRGLTQIDVDLFEFQTAKICKHTDYNVYIENTIKLLNDTNPLKAMPVPTLPVKLETQDLIPYLKGISKVPLGLVKKNLSTYTYDFSKHLITLISSKTLSDALLFSYSVLDELKGLDNVKVSVLNSYESKNNLKKAYNDFVKEVKADIKNDSDVFCLYAIVGLDKFIENELLDESKFNDLLDKANKTGKQSFIFIDNPDKLEDHTYDEWYTNFINQSNGIWVGNGIENQTLINTNFSLNGLENNCGNSFGYVVDEGIPTLIKLVGIEEDGDDDE